MRKLNTLIGFSTACATVFFTGSVQANDLSQKAWADIEAQAKQEGQVVVSIWYLQPQFRTFVKTFEQQYGISVKIPEGTSEGNINKLLAEKTLEKGKMDVIAIGADAYPTVQKSDVLADLSRLPNFSTANHFLQGVELGTQAVGFWGNQTGFAYDPLRLTEEQLPQSWQEMQAYLEKQPRKFGYADPNGGASGKAFIERALIYISGDYDYQHQEFNQAQTEKWQATWDWFAQHKEKMTRTSSNADSLTRLNDGELDLVSAWQDHLFSLQKQGAITPRLKFYIPKFGMPGGGNVLGIAKNSRHPAASLLFVNWIVSHQVQQNLHQAFGVRPLDNQVGKADVLFFPAHWGKNAMATFTKEVVAK
ncbi:extracellular solute-binding protein [Muribacter muris]|uniref:Extracellular solute-binding protein n=1 Tax=Muribacter muris TaxID=67855 RepID=A0A4Y9JYU6_9PAST|nr:extracellular solute-binding protein [Muribacter muris]MBF0785395.1 extracellular solute-binding protein [Muribacter muris]MBF0826049.1 extracellular solute-binding protein [Muribacter muris]TFV09655.1 extracellular solute-binding protein [Muribacter muris]